MGTAAMVWTLGTGDDLPVRGVIESPPSTALSPPEAVGAVIPEPVPTARLTFVAADWDASGMRGAEHPEPTRLQPVDDSRSPSLPSLQPVAFESDARSVPSGRRPVPAVLTGRIELLPPSR